MLMFSSCLSFDGPCKRCLFSVGRQQGVPLPSVFRVSLKVSMPRREEGVFSLRPRLVDRGAHFPRNRRLFPTLLLALAQLHQILRAALVFLGLDAQCNLKSPYLRSTFAVRVSIRFFVKHCFVLSKPAQLNGQQGRADSQRRFKSVLAHNSFLLLSAVSRRACYLGVIRLPALAPAALSAALQSRSIQG